MDASHEIIAVFGGAQVSVYLPIGTAIVERIIKCVLKIYWFFNKAIVSKRANIAPFPAQTFENTPIVRHHDAMVLKEKQFFREFSTLKK